MYLREQLRVYLEKWTVKQLFPSADNRVFVLILPLQSLRQPLDQSSQSTTCEALKKERPSVSRMCWATTCITNTSLFFRKKCFFWTFFFFSYNIFTRVKYFLALFYRPIIYHNKWITNIPIKPSGRYLNYDSVLTIERASPSLSPSSLFMLIDWPNSVVRSFRSLCRAHILWPAATQNKFSSVKIYFVLY